MRKALIIIVIIIGLAAVWYFASPLFLDKKIDEALPFDIEELRREQVMPESMGLETFDALLNMPSQAEIEAMTVPEKQVMEKKMQEMSEKMPPVVVKEDMAEVSGPTLVAQGNFRNADDFHKGSGLAKLVKLEDGSSLLRLENFQVTNGPDLFVYLTNTANPQNSNDVHQGFYDAGRLKGNIGNQNYEIPANIDISDYNAVIIYCRAFSVLFSVASLQ